MEGLQIARTNEVARSFTRSDTEPLAMSEALIVEKDKVIRDLMHSYKELELLYEWSRSTSAPPSCMSSEIVAPLPSCCIQAKLMLLQNPTIRRNAVHADDEAFRKGSEAAS